MSNCTCASPQKGWGWKGPLEVVLSFLPCSKQGQLEQVVQGHVCPFGFWLSQRWRCHNYLGQPIPVFEHSHGKECLNRMFLCLNWIYFISAWASCCLFCLWTADRNPALYFPIRHLDTLRSPWAFSPQVWRAWHPHPLCIWQMLQSHNHLCGSSLPFLECL